MTKNIFFVENGMFLVQNATKMHINGEFFFQEKHFWLIFRSNDFSDLQSLETGERNLICLLKLKILIRTRIHHLHH